VPGEPHLVLTSVGMFHSLVASEQVDVAFKLPLSQSIVQVDPVGAPPLIVRLNVFVDTPLMLSLPDASRVVAPLVQVT